MNSIAGASRLNELNGCDFTERIVLTYLQAVLFEANEYNGFVFLHITPNTDTEKLASAWLFNTRYEFSCHKHLTFALKYYIQISSKVFVISKIMKAR